MIEWELTLKCNFKCPYCFNGRNDVLKSPIFEETDNRKLQKFIVSLKQFNDKIYLYGGEPLLNKNILFILKELEKNKIEYVIQTNFSIYAVIRKITKIIKNAKFQVSVHRTQIKNLQKYVETVKKYEKWITQVDVMFIDKNDIDLYLFLKKNDIKNLRLIPVADFATNKDFFRKSLYLYNKFTKLKPKGFIFEDKERCEIWEKQMKHQISIKNKPCICKNKYIQFDPSLKRHHCPQRFDGDICPFETCYNWDKND